MTANKPSVIEIERDIYKNICDAYHYIFKENNLGTGITLYNEVVRSINEEPHSNKEDDSLRRYAKSLEKALDNYYQNTKEVLNNDSK